MVPRAVIVGTGRSGSGYIAKCLRAVGVDCGHEAYWGPGKPRRPVDVDSSWMAIPVLADFDGMVWHQTRHPLDVISSFVRKWSRTDRYWQTKTKTFRTATGDDLLDAMACWVDANRTCETYASLRWRVEDVDAALVAGLAYRLGVDTDGHAIADVPTTTNKHGHGPRLDWDDLPYPLRSEVEEAADRYGYL